MLEQSLVVGIGQQILERRPRRCVSWTMGPVGTIGRLGAGPRPLGIARQRSTGSRASHSHGLVAHAALSASPPMARAAPVTTSAIHNSMRVSRTTATANRRPSAENPSGIRFAGLGRLARRSAPSPIGLKTRPVTPGVRCGPLVRGLMRWPARRSIGCASSAMGGRLRRSTSATTSRVGLTTTWGSGGASSMSTMTRGGVR